MKVNKYHAIGLLLILALFIRVFPISFPFLTNDEARIAFRGFVLATSAKDELGRVYPVLFNSLIDYQMPLVSYLAALGEKLLGKSDFGVRIPFILLGVGIVFLQNKIARIFSPRKEFWFVSAAIIGFSPALIFLSKIPNESIVLTFFLAAIFYLLIKSKPNLILIFISIILSILSSKSAWFILAPFVMLTLFAFPNNLSKKAKINISILCLLASFFSMMIFWQIPQGQRSLFENNFPIFADVTIKNGINQLRGQGLEITSQPILEKVLFNKAHVLTVGILHWLSQLGPSTLFGQFDSSNLVGFINKGALAKILIIPFGIGLFSIIRRGDRKYRLLLIYPLLLTFPIIFIFPNLNFDFIAATLPFISLIITLGLFNLNRLVRTLILLVMVFEVGVNFFYLDLNIKSTNSDRPGWIKPIVEEGYHLSQEYKVAYSDDITSDIAPFIQWYTPLNPEGGFLDIPFPYKFRQTQISNITIIGSERVFYKCSFDKPTYIIASKRDVKEIKRWLNVKTEEITLKVYKDNLGVDVAYFFEPTICVQ